MSVCFKTLLISFMTITLIAPSISLIETIDLEKHFKEFSEFAVTHHDNIDDTAEVHSHFHKHSEDGQEHEHDHEHSKSFQTTSSILYVSSTPEIIFVESKPQMGFSVDSLISDPHYSDIFRPPIV